MSMKATNTPGAGPGLRSAYAVVGPTGNHVLVIRNQVGYYPCSSLQLWRDLYASQTPAETAAALAASMFGWTVPAADADAYDATGRMYGKRNPKPQSDGSAP